MGKRESKSSEILLVKIQIVTSILKIDLAISSKKKSCVYTLTILHVSTKLRGVLSQVHTGISKYLCFYEEKTAKGKRDNSPPRRGEEERREKQAEK